jgi:hypothetical protein
MFSIYLTSTLFLKQFALTATNESAARQCAEFMRLDSPGWTIRVWSHKDASFLH